MGLLDHGLADNSTVLQHVLKVHQVAVVHMLGIVVCIMEVDDTFLVCIDNLLWKKKTGCNVSADFSSHVVSLDTVYNRILVGVLLLDLLIVTFDEAKNPVVSGVGLSHQRSLVAVSHIFLCNFKGAIGHDLVLHHVLDFLHRCSSIKLIALVLDIVCSFLDLIRSKLMGYVCFICLCNGNNDLIFIEFNF